MIKNCITKRHHKTMKCKVKMGDICNTNKLQIIRIQNMKEFLESVEKREANIERHKKDKTGISQQRKLKYQSTK